MAQPTHGYAADTHARWTSAGVVIAAHAVVLALLWQLPAVRSAVTSVPIVVSLLTPAPEKPQVMPKLIPPPKPQPKPRVQPPPRPQVQPPQPVLAAPEPAPSTQVVAPQPPEPPPPEPPAPVVAAAPPPPPAPLVPPSFNAAYLNNPAPSYPAIARRMGEEGKVVLRVHVNAQGLPEQVEVRTSSGSTRLDDAAQQTVKQWKFVPARRGDKPVDAWVLVPIAFSLRS